MNILKTCALLTALEFSLLAPAASQSQDEQLMAKAEWLAQKILIVDTHIDLPYRLGEQAEDIAIRTQSGDFDYPRAKRGGLKAPFMSIYVPASTEDSGGAKLLADRLIHMVDSIAAALPDKFAVAHSVADIRRNFADGLISLPMGMENGSPIEGDLSNVKYFFTKGIRYITLAHAKSNHISDSSYDKERKWNGLSPFGREVVAEMNRLGIMVDVSHLTDSAFYNVLEASQAPVIATHSSCRYFTPGWERNMSDEMIQALAKNGGVISINFGSEFLDSTSQRRSGRIDAVVAKYREEHALQPTDSAAVEFEKSYRESNPFVYADVKDVVAHIDHVVRLAGVDHVGLGSDFDGLGDSLPTGLKDVSQYPNLIYELLRSGYSDNDIRKICGENVLRVWAQVESVAQRLQHN